MAFPVVKVSAQSTVRQVSAEHGVVGVVGSKDQIEETTDRVVTIKWNIDRELERENIRCLLSEFHSDINKNNVHVWLR